MKVEMTPEERLKAHKARRKLHGYSGPIMDVEILGMIRAAVEEEREEFAAAIRARGKKMTAEQSLEKLELFIVEMFGDESWECGHGVSMDEPCDGDEEDDEKKTPCEWDIVREIIGRRK